MLRAFAAQKHPRLFPQLLVNQWSQFLERRTIARTPAPQQNRNVPSITARSYQSIGGQSARAWVYRTATVKEWQRNRRDEVPCGMGRIPIQSGIRSWSFLNDAARKPLIAPPPPSLLSWAGLHPAFAEPRHEVLKSQTTLFVHYPISSCTADGHPEVTQEMRRD